MASSKKLSILGVLLVLATLSAAASLAYADDGDVEIAVPERPEQQYPNLGSSLNQLIANIEAKQATGEAAADSSVHNAEEVAVTIYLSGVTDGVVAFLEEHGVSPRNVGDGYIEAYLPVALLGPVSELPGVIRIREIVPPEPSQLTQRVRGQGPLVHGSNIWNRAGYSGQGIKVGVIDTLYGFNGLRELRGDEIPLSVEARCYTDVSQFTSDLRDCAHTLFGNDHGTMVAEAAVDIAPEASLYVATPWSLGDIREAVDWMASEGVSVIVYPLSSAFDGPGDGTSPFGDSPLNTVDRAVDSGIIWVSAAGNSARRHWTGPYSASVGENVTFLEFENGDIFNDIPLFAGDYVTVQLRWDDTWAGANRDLNLWLWDFTAGDFVEYSLDVQEGRQGQVPYELLSYRAPADGWYGVVVSHQSGSAPDWFEIRVSGVPAIEYYTESRSISSPAESANPGMLAVGAAPWYDVHEIEGYSSRGPTRDGRIKPDVVGADCGANALEEPAWRGFCGTSQAVAHLGGMAALVRQRFPDMIPADVADYLKEHAEQRKEPDPNNTWGHGFAVLPISAVTTGATPGSPAITGVAPATDSLTVVWDAPAQTGGAAVTAYDLRYIRTSADETVDANWTLLDLVWDGDFSRFYYQITGLATGTRYDVQVRAVNANGAGPWSTTASGTPAQWQAARSFSAASVGPGAEVVVTVTAAGYGVAGQVVETLPDGFGYVSSSLPGAVDRAGQVITFTLLGDTSFTYTVTAPNAAGSYSFDGVLMNLGDELISVGGASIVTVGGPPSVELAGSGALVRINTPILVTVTFSEPVFGFTIDDITVSNGAVSNLAGSDGNTVYTFDVTPNAIGGVMVGIPGGAATDGGGNGNTPSSQLSLGITYDDDGDGQISKNEAIGAVREYFNGNLTKEQTIAVIRLYFVSG